MGTLPKHIILILCGGSGPRLWPLSRASNPKQFLSILSQHSLLEQTIVRATRLVSPDRVFLITNHKYKSKIKQISRPLIPSKNIISEPDKKNTAMAIIYATSIIQKHFPGCIITSAPSDHFIGNLPKYKKDVQQAYRLASKSKKIVLIGITPKGYNQSYGHILPGKSNQVKRFIEKPDRKQHKNFLTKKYYWNSGIYTFSPQALETELLLHQSKYFLHYKNLSSVNNPRTVHKTIYNQSENLSIDNAISEKSNNLLFVPATFAWSDIGEWETIYQLLPKKSNGFAIINSDSQYIQHNSSNCLISGSKNKLVGLVGVKDLAVIDTPSGLLICNLADDSSFQVRDLVKLMTENSKTTKFFLK